MSSQECCSRVLHSRPMSYLNQLNLIVINRQTTSKHQVMVMPKFRVEHMYGICLLHSIVLHTLYFSSSEVSSEVDLKQ